MSVFSTLSRRTKVLALTASVLLALTAAGAYLKLRTRSVPEIPLEGQEIAVVEKVKVARHAVIMAPRSAKDWAYLGQVLLANEVSLDIALVCFLEAGRLDPQEPRWPYFAAGLLVRNLGKPAEALPQFERAVFLAESGAEPNFTPRLFLAETLVSLGRSDEAAVHFKKVLAAERNNPRAHLGLGLFAYARGDWQRCRTHLEACLGAPQARKRACINLAMACKRLQDHEASEKYANLAARARTDVDWPDPYAAGYLNLAVRLSDRIRAVETLEAQGQIKFATDILRTMLAEHPDDYRAHAMMGRIQGKTGQFASAESHLLQARQLAPDKVQVHYLLSLVLGRSGEAMRAKQGDSPKVRALFEESAKSAQQALALSPDYGLAHMSLGLAFKQLGQRPEALAAFRKAAHCNPEFADIHLYLGEALADEGEATQARYHLELARLLAPPNDPRPKTALEKLSSQTAPKSK